MNKTKKVIWFTGLSGSGKTTIARALQSELEKNHKKVKMLDGDSVRGEQHKHLDFTSEDIKENNRLIVELCTNCVSDYDYILVSVISPFKESRQKARNLLKEWFVEIYIKAPLALVIERDVKGYYQKALAGKLDGFIGIDKSVPYEEPENPDMIIDTSKLDIKGSVQKILSYLNF